jgi:sodium/bile acid cotransporter 7
VRHKCVGNRIRIITIPFSLQLLAGDAGNLELPALGMLAGLVTTVLVPIILGQISRPAPKAHIVRYKGAFLIFQQCIVLLIIFDAFAAAWAKIGTAGAMLPGLIVFFVGLHSLILLIDFGICKVIRLDRPLTTVLTIHTPQKTLPVSYLAWAGSFVARYPLVLIPGIIYHLTQIVMDTLVAERFKKLNLRHKCDSSSS